MAKPELDVIRLVYLSELFTTRFREYVMRNRVLIALIELSNFVNEQNLLWDYLSHEEKSHSKKISIERIKIKYITTRGVLRLLIANLIDIPPAAIIFDISHHGKPSIAKQHNPFNISFNLSHSGSLIMFAFTQGSEVGVDIEQCRAHLSNFEVVQSVLSDQEWQKLKLLPPSSQMPAFTKLWTKKEAISKAFGAGLAINFKQLDVGFDDEGFESFLLDNHMVFFDLTDPAQYFASVAIHYS
jgi:4'-phosphopantetheinyl transferase